MTKKIANVGMITYSKAMFRSGLSITICCAIISIVIIIMLLNIFNSRTEDLAGNTIYVIQGGTLIIIVLGILCLMSYIVMIMASNFYAQSAAKKQDYEKGKKEYISMVEIRGGKGLQYYIAVYDDVQNCPSCGASLDGTGVNFCPKCGQSLSDMH